jgi:hypothetical protein
MLSSDGMCSVPSALKLGVGGVSTFAIEFDISANSTDARF